MDIQMQGQYNNSKFNRIVNPKTTGTVAAGSLALTALSGATKNKNFKKTHKPLAFVTSLSVLAHVVSIGLKKYKNKILAEKTDSEAQPLRAKNIYI